MKKLTYLLLVAGVAMLASCTKPSDKAKGTYTGNATINSTQYSCVTTVTANGDDKADISATSNSITYAVSGVGLTLSNDVVTFAYSSNTTTSNDVKAVAGTVTNNALAITMTIVLSGSITYDIPITGTK